MPADSGGIGLCYGAGHAALAYANVRSPEFLTTIELAPSSATCFKLVYYEIGATGTSARVGGAVRDQSKSTTSPASGTKIAHVRVLCPHCHP
jgi:hypothetical protein